MAKIPSQAVRVFKGEIFDIYQWQQAMFDGSTATFEMAKRSDTVVVIPLIGSQIAYSQQEQPGKPLFLGLFGGRADKDEEPLEAAKRELLEEAGLESEDWTLWQEFVQPGKLQWSVFYYIAKNCRKVKGQSLDKGGEKIVVKYANTDDFFNHIVPDENFREFELKSFLHTTPFPLAEKVNHMKKLIA